MKPIAIEQINGLALAYLGDAVWESAVRTHLLEKGLTKPQQLHQTAIHFVSAGAQEALMQAMIAADFLTADELRFFKKGRNATPHSSAKNASLKTYHQATGFEALIGYLDLQEDHTRLDEVIVYCISLREATDGTAK